LIAAFNRDITERKQSELALKNSNSQLERMVYDVTEAMGRIVEFRDPYTNGHEVRVAQLAKLLAEEMGLSDEEIVGIEMAALVHDIGKLGVPAEILTKPGQISANEFAIIKEHSEFGYGILKDIAFPWPVAETVLQHHERMDGTGYPRGLAGDRIGTPARIIAVADVIEAMASDRPYRAALGLDTAVEEIVSHPEKYDGDTVTALLRLHAAERIAW
jgi:putative nucleotidyltransferase with HDIG domain